MTRVMIALITVLVLVILFVAVWRLLGRVLLRKKKDGMAAPPPSDLAKKLAAAGWTLYMREGCPWCTRQKQALGGRPYSRTVTCPGDGGARRLGPGTLSCGNVSGYPHWHNPVTGEVRRGYQDGPKLAQMARRH